MKSMTGYGLGDAPLATGRVVVETRAVNHRFLDVRVRLPRELGDCAMLVEQFVRGRLTRGRCEVVVHCEGAPLAAPAIDRERARAAYRGFEALRDEIAPGAEVPLSLLAAVPDLFVPAADAAAPATRAALGRGVEASIDDMDAMRVREGGALAVDLGLRAGRVRDLCRTMRGRAPEVIEAYRARTRERVRALLGEDEIAADPARLEHEVVLFAERCDVCEELTRLAIHLDAVDHLLSSAGPVGRRLDFLLQEMLREANTVGSKCQDAPLTCAVVEVKTELERMREQAQNVE